MQGWLTEPIESEQNSLLRVRNKEEEWNYVGPVSGIVLYPSEDYDPVRLEFDSDLYVQEFTKTQFAGPELLGLLAVWRRRSCSSPVSVSTNAICWNPG